MKIAVNTRFLIKDKLEGIGRFTYESIKQLVVQHPEDEFIFLFDRPYSKEFIFADNVMPIVLFPQARHPFLFYWWFEFSVSKALKEHKADVFISTDGFLSLRTSVPTLLVVHDIAFYHYPEQVKKYWEKKYYSYFMSRFMEKATKIIAVSNYTKQDIVKHYSIPASKIDVAYNACDSHFKPISLVKQTSIREQYTNGKPYFLYVGSVHPRKNIPRLLKAFDLFKQEQDSEMKLLLAGRLAWQTGLVNEVYKAMKHKEEVIFLDFVTSKELPDLLASAFALTYVSTFEGFGIPILEAMMCDVPVITSNVSSMPEVAGKAAVLVDPFSVDSIANGMSELWYNKVKRDQIIADGRWQRQKFNWADTAQKLWDNLLIIK